MTQKDEKKLTKKEQMELEKETTIKQINSLFLKLCIWELESPGLILQQEKDELVELREKVENKLKEV